jgi:predicted transcriptional regulator
LIVRRDDNGLIVRRTFHDLRRVILISLVSGQKTVNQVSRSTKINWRSVVIHLNYLVEKGLVRNLVNSPYVKIFELSETGKEFIALLGLDLEKSANQESKKELKIQKVKES